MRTRFIALALTAAAGLSAPMLSPACTVNGYLITVIVPENFPASSSSIFVRKSTSTGAVSSAASFNPTLVAGASAAVMGGQRVLMTATGGGAGACPSGDVGVVTELVLRP